MFKTLKLQNFKSWRDTGNIFLANITGFFGTNSSGKSSILQFFLLLKQTVESSDRQRVLNTGDERSYVELGTFYDIAHDHIIPSSIYFELSWNLLASIPIANDINLSEYIFLNFDNLHFCSKINLNNQQILVDYFSYFFKNSSNKIGFIVQKKSENNLLNYELKSEGYKLISSTDKYLTLLPPIKHYGFPNQAVNYFKNADFLPFFTLAYEEAFQKLYYLGPLREYPKRIYSWAGEKPQDVGRRGEFAIAALLASPEIQEHIAYWLKELGLINSFHVQPIADNRPDYEVQVQRFQDSSKVLITDVGFGVSQILPVLVLCYYVPSGSTIILEQPEIHLHPSVQAGLADVFIHAIKTRQIQIIIESHSEHLLRRLQRRIAEEKEGLSNQDIKLYFCDSNLDGSSNLTPLEIDNFGNIRNWPENFFGDEMGDLFAMTEAAMKRQLPNERL